GAGSSATPAAQAPAAPVESATPAVDRVGPPAVRSRPGQVRDPFRRRKPKAVKPASTAKAASAAHGTGTSTATGGGSSTPDSTSTGAKSGASTAKAKAVPRPVAPIESAAAIAARSTYETVARFSGPRARYEHPLAGLAVFGGTAKPALQFLGVGAGGEFAIFLLGPGAIVSGDDGTCVVASPCRAVGVRRGEAIRVAIAGAHRTIRRYTLKVTSLRRVRKATKALAKAQRQHVAVNGRAVLRKLVKDAPTAAALAQLHYVSAAGTVAFVDAK
ncbi:MAG: hypothetical protein QOJ63_1240, partial [Solirubrobacteraceae bacterium]|nr:hypothetical protein [Solirubrobacteraceae bacterium]